MNILIEKDSTKVGEYFQIPACRLPAYYAVYDFD